MINNKTGLGAALAVAMLFTGCDTDGVNANEPSPYEDAYESWLDDDGRIVMRTQYDNAIAHNGVRFNGIRFNGIRFNGIRFNGIRFNGIRFNGTNLNNPRMNGNKVAADDDQANTLEDTALEDVRIDADIEDPDTQVISDVEYSITEIEVTASGLVLQRVKHRELPDGLWEDACENGAKSLQIKGDWDLDTGDRTTTSTDASTWACLGAAIGDCAAWGYIPGNLHGGSTDLADHHQTCTRLKRADYCGQGVPTTQNGTSIDVYDNLDINVPGSAWPVEGFWGPDGAICLSHTRKTDWTKSNPPEEGAQYIGCEIPTCEDVNQDGNIDFADYPTALLANRNVQTDP